jgi:uncharacterized protein with NAD-binding domain and iron-sulfur cluster
VLSEADLEYFSTKLWQVMTSCADRRLAEYELISWEDFIDADNRSPAYKSWFAGAMTRTLIAASGQMASSRTVGDITVDLVLGGFRWGSLSDRLLNGPTNEVWMDPWLTYLESKGVTFHPGERVVELTAANGQIAGATLEGPDGSHVVTADRYICALPVEVMAGLITDAIADLSPSLAASRTLGPRTAWMAGIQFYLHTDVPIVHGHVVYAGSQWGLTSVSQQQFWKHRVSKDSGGRVNGVLSVDISDWETAGNNGKTARQCTPREIRDEVLLQLRKSLPELPESALADSNIDSFFIDPDVIFFDAAAGASGQGVPVANHEPLFINEIGTYLVRPNAHTEIANLFLASDYVRTNTDLATMEGANEAARRAVNALLDGTPGKHRLCRLWSLHEPLVLAPLRWMDKRRFRRGQPWSPDVPRVFRWTSSALHRVTRRRR